MPVWSEGPAGSGSIAHAMHGPLGQPAVPLCGRKLEGLWFRRDHEWHQVPTSLRCPDCDDRMGATTP